MQHGLSQRPLRGTRAAPNAMHDAEKITSALTRLIRSLGMPSTISRQEDAGFKRWCATSPLEARSNKANSMLGLTRNKKITSVMPGTSLDVGLKKSQRGTREHNGFIRAAR
eukprot:2819575-Pyramimonas_sp.AAC.1